MSNEEKKLSGNGIKNKVGKLVKLIWDEFYLSGPPSAINNEQSNNNEVKD